MKKHIVFIIRYSVLQHQSKAWQSSSLSLDDQLEKLFSDERMTFRQSIFKEITVHSLLSQEIPEDTTYSVLLLTSEHLPLLYKDFLKEIKSDFEKKRITFKIEYISSNGIAKKNIHKNINEAIKSYLEEISLNNKNILLSTARLDDDDGLAKNFVAEASNFMAPPNIGSIISFAYGIEGFFNLDKKNFHELKHFYYPKNAQGLLFINAISNGKLVEKSTIHIYNTGNHTRVDEYYPTIVCARKIMYFRTLSNFNDSVGSPHHKYLKDVTKKEDLQNFSFLKNISPPPKASQEKSDDIEISKTCSPWVILIHHLNTRISLREKQLRDAQTKLKGITKIIEEDKN